MKIYKFNQWTREEPHFHAVKKADWVKGEHKLLVLRLNTYCEKEYQFRPRDKYIPYDKSVHRKQICPDCVKVLRAILKERAKVN